MSVTVVAAGPEHADGLLALFERTGSPCHCRWWHFAGDKNAWLDRCANAVALNQAELRAALESASEEARGAIALDSTGEVVGWLKLAPASAVPKIYEQRLYKGLPCFTGDRRGVWVIGCFLIDERFRGRGVARALLEGGLGLARDAGARAVEAFPRRATGVPAEQLWTGPERLYLAAGFRVVSEQTQYPVLRAELD